MVSPAHARSPYRWRIRIALHVGRYIVPARLAQDHHWGLEDPLAENLRRLRGRISLEKEKFITPSLFLSTAVKWEWKIRGRPNGVFAVKVKTCISYRQSLKWPAVNSPSPSRRKPSIRISSGPVTMMPPLLYATEAGLPRVGSSGSSEPVGRAISCPFSTKMFAGVPSRICRSQMMSKGAREVRASGANPANSVINITTKRTRPERASSRFCSNVLTPPSATRGPRGGHAADHARP